MKSDKEKVEEILKQQAPSPIIKDNLNKNSIIFDLTENNKDLTLFLKENPGKFNKWSQNMLKKYNVKRGIGKCFEERVIYSQDIFHQKIIRCIHLGIDISGNENEKIHSPFKGKIHSLNNNDAYGDYGPTVILQHEIKESVFYTLYGHLSTSSLNKLIKGQEIDQGEDFASLGGTHENGGYNPHLHFQVITDLLGKEGDFPGVCMKDDLEKYQKICIDPNLILEIQGL